MCFLFFLKKKNFSFIKNFLSDKFYMILIKSSTYEELSDNLYKPK